MNLTLSTSIQHHQRSIANPATKTTTAAEAEKCSSWESTGPTSEPQELAGLLATIIPSLGLIGLISKGVGIGGVDPLHSHDFMQIPWDYPQIIFLWTGSEGRSLVQNGTDDDTHDGETGVKF